MSSRSYFYSQKRSFAYDFSCLWQEKSREALANSFDLKIFAINGLEALANSFNLKISAFLGVEI